MPNHGRLFILLCMANLLIGGMARAATIVHYDFNVPPGTIVIPDTSGNGIDLTLGNGGAIVADPLGTRGSVLLNAAGQVPEIVVAESSNIDGTVLDQVLAESDFTIEGIFLTTGSQVVSGDSWATIFTLGRSTSHLFADRIGAFIREGGVFTDIFVEDGARMPNNPPLENDFRERWTHLALTYSRSQNLYSWFVNGKRVATVTPAVAPNGFETDGVPKIALLADVWDRRDIFSFDAYADEFRISDEALYTDDFANVGAGGIYVNLRAALDNYLSGDAWGNDAGDDVLIVDGLVDHAPIFSDYQRLSPSSSNRSWMSAFNSSGTSGTLTIRGVNNAIIRHVGNARFTIRCMRGTLNLEDIIFMPDSDATDDHVWSPIGVEPSVAAGPMILNVNRCIVTRSTQIDPAVPATVPRLDWGTDPAPYPQAVGNYRHGVEIGLDDPAQSGATITLTDSTFAFTSRDCIPTNNNTRAPKSGSVAIKNCLFVGNSLQTVQFRNTYMTLDVEDCGFFYNGITRSGPDLVRTSNGAPIQISGNNLGIAHKPIVVSGSIFMNNGQVSAIRCHESVSSLTLQQCTVYEDNTAVEAIVGAVYTTNAELDLTLRDVIFDGSTPYNIFKIDSGVLRPRVEIGQAVVGGATLPPSGPIADLFALVYGGSGPLTDDPQFAQTVWNSAYDGMRGWHHESNPLLDVSNVAYKGKGSAGNLAGGADSTFPEPAVPIEVELLDRDRNSIAGFTNELVIDIRPLYVTIRPDFLQFDETPDFADPVQIVYQDLSNYPYTLRSTADGIKTVWVRTVADGLSAPTSATIQLDRTAPPPPPMPSSSAPVATAGTVSFAWDAVADSEPGSGLKSYQLQLGSEPGLNNLGDFDALDEPHLTRQIARGETVYARVRATDRAGNAGEWSPVSSPVYMNRLPAIQSVQIVPAVAYTYDDLVTSITASDPDAGDTIAGYEYRWTLGGQVVSQEASISAALTTKNQIWAVDVRAVDTFGEFSSWMATSNQIRNAPPSQPFVLILPRDPVPGQGLVVDIQEYSIDSDGDEVGYDFKWYKSTDGGATWIYKVELDGSSQVNELYINEGELWRVELMPFEKTSAHTASLAAAPKLTRIDGSAAFDQVYVGDNHPPALSFTNIAVTPDGAQVRLDAAWTANDADGEACTVDLYWIDSANPCLLALGHHLPPQSSYAGVPGLPTTREFYLHAIVTDAKGAITHVRSAALDARQNATKTDWIIYR